MPRSRWSTRRVELALGLAVALVAGVSATSGCAERTEASRPAATRPAPPLDARVPEGLQTATFGLG